MVFFLGAAPGASWMSDVDRDGLPDFWEASVGLDAQNPWDGEEDSDGDGYTNREEFGAGSHPQSALSRLHFEIVYPESGTDVRLAWRAVEGRYYAVETKGGWGSGESWQVWTNIAAGLVGRDVAIPLPNGGGQRFYRLRVDAQASTFDPCSVDTNLVAWWRAYHNVTMGETGKVRWVEDGSGWGHDLGQESVTAQPTLVLGGLSGHDTILFDGVDDWLRTETLDLAQPTSMYLLFRQAGWTPFACLLSGTKDGRLIQLAESPLLFMRTSNQIGPARRDLPVGEFGILHMRWDGAQTKMSVDNGVVSGGVLESTGLGGLILGASTAAGQHGHLEFVEMIVRQGVDTEDTRHRHLRYLSSVAGIPYRLIVFAGNSLTAGAGLGERSIYSTQVITNLSPHVFYGINRGIGGATTPQMASLGDELDRLCRSDQAANILCAWEITNHLYQGATAEEAYEDFVEFCQARQRRGWKVIALTVLPRRGGVPPAGFEENRQLINSWMRANFKSFANALADVALDPDIGCPECPLDQRYYSDQTHLTADGYARVARIVASQVRALSPAALHW